MRLSGWHLRPVRQPAHNTGMQTNNAIWSKSGKSWGSALRMQRNVYALLVTLAMTGGRHACPSCNAPLGFDCEVDRVIPALDYRPGNVAYICHACNASRGVLQSSGSDWSQVARYADDVTTASLTVGVPTPREAAAIWRNRTKPVTARSQYL